MTEPSDPDQDIQDHPIDPIEVIYDGSRVGLLRAPIRDMWNIEGNWVPDPSPEGACFHALISQLDIRQTMTAGAMPLEIQIRFPGGTPETAIAFGLLDDIIAVKHPT